MTQQPNVDPLRWLTEQALHGQQGDQSRAMVVTMANAVGAELDRLRQRVAELEATQSQPKESLED